MSNNIDVSACFEKLITMVDCIVSGGQTGADRAALDFAIQQGIRHAGWCPLGRVAEDGLIGQRYALKETPLGEPSQRTEWNVRDSDGTLIISVSRTLSGGSKLTAEYAESHSKPCLHVSREADGNAAADRVRAFIREHRIRVLNVAGPRESGERAVGAFVMEVLSRALLAEWGDRSL